MDWFFEPRSFRPMARWEGGTLAYVVNDHLGTPTEVVTETGALLWTADHDTWGGLRAKRLATGTGGDDDNYWLTFSPEPTEATGAEFLLDAQFCPIRFQGQWEDAETGLYQNRFRYYDARAIIYISADPLGLKGSDRSHAYVQTPSNWNDALGLSPCPSILYHYTTEKGMNAIRNGCCLRPSLRRTNPNDARYGDGQYLTDIEPGTRTNAQLSRALVGIPFQGNRFTHYVAVDVSGLDVACGRDGVFVIPNDGPLDLTNRIVEWGVN